MKNLKLSMSVCGTTQEVQRYLDDNKFKLVSMSLGREGANRIMVIWHIL